MQNHATMSDSPRPKNYLTDEERAEKRAGGMSENGILLAESGAAGRTGNEEAAWAWLALVELPAHSLAFLKDRHGADFVRSRGFNTTQADAEYGPGWLDGA